MTDIREEILRNLSYNPSMGKFYWRIPKGPVKEGDVAGTIHRGKDNCYIYIVVNRVSYKAHRLAFLVMKGEWPEYVDHIDGDGLNNKWDNLREVSHQDNTKNCTLRKNNKSGQMGVRFKNELKKWVVSINIDYKQIHLGCFSDYDEVVKVRKDAEKKYGFHENHGRKKRELV